MRRLMRLLLAAVISVAAVTASAPSATADDPGHQLKGHVYLAGAEGSEVITVASPVSTFSGLGRVTIEELELTLSQDPAVGDQAGTFTGLLTVAGSQGGITLALDGTFVPDPEMEVTEGPRPILLSGTATWHSGTERYANASGSAAVFGGYCVVNHVGFLGFDGDVDLPHAD